MSTSTPEELGAAWLARSRAALARTPLRAEASEIGRVEQVADGIARVSGLPGVRLDELLRFADGSLGFALSLDRESIGVVLLDEGASIAAGSEVRGTGEVLQVPVGPGLLGRVVDPLGRPLDRDEPVVAELHLPIERPAPAIIERAAVSEPVETGVLIVDALFAIGRGQRELIIGDRATGKTSLALDAGELQECRAALAAALGGERPLLVEIAPELIAGIELEGSGAVVRNSFRADLARLQRELNRHEHVDA